MFEAQIKQSFQTIEKVDQLLAEKPTPQRHDQIIKMIRDRAITRKLEMIRNDRIDDRLVESLSGIASSEELLSLLPDVPRDTGWQLENMLRGNAGRDYLLHRPADQSQTMADRLQFAEILSGAGDTVNVTIPDVAFGIYRVFLRNSGDTQPDGDGLGFEIDVPKK